MDNMPPEPPPPSGESDYAPAPVRRVNVAPLEPDSHRPFGVDDVPIPAHLLSVAETPDLNAAWANVLVAEHEPIPERGFNKFFQYHYATADDIRMYVGRELGKNGLHYEQHTAGFTVSGNLIRVTYYFVIRHSSGQSTTPIRHDELTRTTSEKGAPDDKALGKASVLALKNFTKVHFSIDTGDLADDPDAEGPVVDAAPARRQQPVRQTTSEQKPEPKLSEKSFLERAAFDLDAEANGTKWIKLLSLVYGNCNTLDDIGRIRTIYSYKETMKKAPSIIKSQIEDMEKAAVARITPQFEPKEGKPAGKPVNTVAEAQKVAEALRAEHAGPTEDPHDEGDGWPGPKD